MKKKIKLEKDQKDKKEVLKQLFDAGAYNGSITLKIVLWAGKKSKRKIKKIGVYLVFILNVQKM